MNEEYIYRKEYQRNGCMYEYIILPYLVLKECMYTYNTHRNRHGYVYMYSLCIEFFLKAIQEIDIRACFRDNWGWREGQKDRVVCYTYLLKFVLSVWFIYSEDKYKLLKANEFEKTIEKGLPRRRKENYSWMFFCKVPFLFKRFYAGYLNINLIPLSRQRV